MASRILTLSLATKAQAELESLLPMVGLQHATECAEVQDLISREGDGIGLLIVDAQIPADQCVSLFRWVELYANHVQCVVVALEDDLPKIIEIKNKITSMSVARYPWQQDKLLSLVHTLTARSEEKAAEDRFLRKSLAPFAVNLGQARVTTIYQLLGLQNDGNGSERVLSYLEVAVSFRDTNTMGSLSIQDISLHAREEAVRMAQIMEHVRKWHEAFDDGSPVRSLPSVFSVLMGDLIIRDIEDQLVPCNGPIRCTPTAGQCCLLALLSWSKSSAVLSKRFDGLWVVEDAHGLPQFQSSLSQILA